MDKMQDMLRWQAFLKEDGSGIDVKRGSVLTTFDRKGKGETLHFDVRSTLDLLVMFGAAVEATVTVQEERESKPATQASNGPTV